tara:strand:- start:1256 stop:2227 length:972 start_codon:yes stop_codon:yes gene_type:complete
MNRSQLYLILTVVLFSSTYGFGQRSFEEIKDDTVNLENGILTCLKNVQLFQDEKIDSLDIVILRTPGFISGLVKRMHRNNGHTYEDLKLTYLKAKDSKFIKQTRALYEVQPFLDHTIVKASNWENDKQKLKKLINNDQQLEVIGDYVEQYTDSAFTYSQLLTIIRKHEQQKKPVGLDDLLREYHMAKIDSLIELSKEIGKPILLYFNGHNVVNARKLEMRIMNKKNIISHLEEHFIFVNLLVDSRKEIPKEDHYYSDRLEKQVTTIGAFNMDYQLKRFEMNRQPFLVVLNRENEVLGTRKYDELKSSEQLLMFLEEMRKEFNN